MRKDLLGAVARSALAFMALAVLLVGLPVALAVLAGWPLPSAVPTLAQIRDSLSGPSITDALLVKGIAAICWLAWAQLVACAVVETHAWARGRVAVHLPLAGAMQPIVRQLVLSVVFLAGALRSPVPVTVPLRAVAAVELMPIRAMTDMTTVAAPEQAGPTTAAPEAALPTCVVRPRDSLWSLSEDHLGDGYRWRELFELNRGVVQADGRSLQESNLIRPGWTLRFPADVTGLAVPLVETSSPPPATSPPTALPTPVPQEARSVSPEVPAPASPSDQTTPATTATTQAGSALDSVGAQQAPQAIEDDDHSGLPIPASVAGLGLMAAGVVVTLDRLRRVQQRKRRDGHMIPVPTGPSAEAERMLRTAASHSPTDRLDAALRAFSAQLSRAETGPIPAIEAVSVGPDSVEILLSGPARAPSGPFDVTAGGRSWVLPAGVDVADATTNRSAPAPALVTIGAVDGRQILVDLEAHPRTALIGRAPEAIFAALVLELCTSRWADTLHVVLAGPPPSGARAYERLRVVTSIEEVLDDLEAESLALTSELAASKHGSTFSARLAETADGWVPTVVLVTDPTDPALDRLLLVASENHGLAVVVLGEQTGDVDRTISVGLGTVRVAPPGLDLTASSITTADAAAIDAVMDLATSDEPGNAILLDAPCSPAGATIDEVAAAPRPEIDVQILGSPEVVGGKAPIDRRKSKELVVYLALHPRGVDEGRLKNALWPDQVPSPGSFNQTMSRARMCLGRNADDEHYLPHVADGLYRLSPAVDTDFRRLEQAFAAATTNGTEATMGRLADALSMVRGMPFEGAGAGYEWAHTEGLLARVEAIAADAALLLAEWNLDRRDTAKAIWAAGQGLRASPGDERLFRIRMRAHDQAGNPAGVESVMAELCRVVEALEPFDDLHPDTIALYDELSRRRRRTG